MGNIKFSLIDSDTANIFSPQNVGISPASNSSLYNYSISDFSDRLLKAAFKSKSGVLRGYFVNNYNKKGENEPCVSGINVTGPSDIYEDLLPDVISGVRASVKYSAIKKQSKVVAHKPFGRTFFVQYGWFPSNEINIDLKLGWSKSTEQHIIVPTFVPIVNNSENVSTTYELTYIPYEIFRFTGTSNGNRTDIKYIRVPSASREGYDYFEVTPLIWIVDPFTNSAISETTLTWTPYKDRYGKSIPEDWLERYFAPNMEELNSVFGFGSYKENDSMHPVQDESKNEAEKIIDKIREEIVVFKDKDFVESILKDRIDQYKVSLERVENKIGTDSLTLSLNGRLDSKQLFAELVYDLNIILEKIQKYKETITNGDYETIAESINIIKNKEKQISTDNDFINTISQLANIILPTLPQEIREHYEERILEILNEELEVLQETFEIYFEKGMIPDPDCIRNIRTKLQPVLEELSIDVSKNHILESTKKIVAGIYQEENTTLEAFYLQQINQTVARIKNIGKDRPDYIEKAKLILNNNHSITPEIIEYFKEIGLDISDIKNSSGNLYVLVYIFIKLEKILCELQEIQNQINEINNYRVDL